MISTTNIATLTPAVASAKKSLRTSVRAGEMGAVAQASAKTDTDAGYGSISAMLQGARFANSTY